MAQPFVLIAGAGPTGLVLAIALARRGVAFRIIDDDAGPGPHSRAVVVHARTLEFYDQFGFADDVIAHGLRTERGRLREVSNGNSRDMLTFSFGDLGEGISKFPFALVYPQDEHEAFLVGVLARLGVSVEWNTRLTAIRESADGVSATLQRGDGTVESVDVAYVCGCDGVHSAVRAALNIGFQGGTYDHTYFVADVRLVEGFETDLILNLGKDVFTLMLPVRTTGMQRLIGIIRTADSAGRDITFESLQREQESLIGKHVAEVNWFSTYRVHHRVASAFRSGRAFLLGDAAHVHSPVGGQGMNTGIGDAINLAWKLAMVANAAAPDALLDTYEPERIAFARQLVATTDRAFTGIIQGGVAGELVRRALLPLFFGVGTSFAAGRHAIFRLISQTQIQYEDGPLSEGHAGRVKGGDRLPWFADGAVDNYVPLRSLDWQVHVYGDADPQFADECRRVNVPLHQFAWTTAAQRAGLREDAAYLVRPDAHVALTLDDQDGDALAAYMAEHALRALTTVAG